MSAPALGVHYFITLSLDVDYTPSTDMISKISKSFPEWCYVAQEKGSSGKLHVHVVGRSTKRQDNIRRMFLGQLAKEGYALDEKYSVDVIPEPNPIWRIGYLQKEADCKCLLNLNIAQATVAAAKEAYDAKPKRARPEKKGSRISVDALVDECIASGCDTDYLIRDFLKEMKRSGKLPFSVYCKIPLKRLISYVTEKFDDDR